MALSSAQIAQLNDAEVIILMNQLVREVSQRLSERTLDYSDDSDSDAWARNQALKNDNVRAKEIQKVPADENYQANGDAVPGLRTTNSKCEESRRAAQKSILKRYPDDRPLKRHRIEL